MVIGISHNWLNPGSPGLHADYNRPSFSAFNYRILSTFTPEKSFYNVHLGLSLMTMFPTTLDLFGDALRSDPNYEVLPNPDLKEEKSANVDIGARFLLPESGVSFDVSVFYNKISNLIKAVNLTDSTEQSMNLESARNIGMELTAQYKVLNILTAYLSYSLLDAKNTSSNRKSDHLAYLPEHQLKLFASCIPYKEFGGDVTVTYVAKRYFDLSGIWNSLNAYWLVDVSVSSEFLDGLSLYGKIYNILDENYQVANGFPQPGREFIIGLRYTY
jgi:iron complex outermembrane receptor protein